MNDDDRSYLDSPMDASMHEDDHETYNYDPTDDYDPCMFGDHSWVTFSGYDSDNNYIECSQCECCDAIDC